MISQRTSKAWVAGLGLDLLGPRQHTTCVTCLEAICSWGYKFLTRVVRVPWSRLFFAVRIFSNRPSASCGMPFSYASEAIVLASWPASVYLCLTGTEATISIVNKEARTTPNLLLVSLPASKCSSASTKLPDWPLSNRVVSQI